MSLTSQHSTTLDLGNSDNTDGADSDESTATSIRPDLPHSLPVTRIISEESLIPSDISFCWINANCAHYFKCETEYEVEVGPWRDEILSNLNSLRMESETFSYPNAIERNVSTWCKNVSCRMLHHSHKSSWIRGQLEISNNDTLVFYKVSFIIY